MHNRVGRNNRGCTGWLELFAGALLVVGLFFRFYNLDKKVYWNDEVWTSLWLSGHHAAEMTEQVFDGRELTIHDLQRYQRISSDRGWRRTITSLAADDPKQAPLYYALLKHLPRLPVLILALYAAYFFYRRSAKRVWLMPLALAGIPALTPMLPDLVSGGRSISSPRFLIPCYLGVQLATA
jgi:uncharacterized membrane protein